MSPLFKAVIGESTTLGDEYGTPLCVMLDMTMLLVAVVAVDV